MSQLIGLKLICPRVEFGPKKVRELATRAENPLPVRWDSTRRQYVADEAAIAAWEAVERAAQIPVKDALEQGLIPTRKAS